MNPRVLAQVLGLAGGLAWLVRWGAHLAGSDPGWLDVAYAIGLVALPAAAGLAETGVVKKTAVWLRLVVGVATCLLVASVVLVVQGKGDAVALNGLLGLLALVVVGLTFHRTRRVGMGAHAAR